MSETSFQFDPAELADLYAVGAVTAEEAAEFERRVSAGDAACRREFERVRPVIEALAGAVKTVEVGAASRRRLEEALESARSRGGRSTMLKLSDAMGPAERGFGVDPTRLSVVRLEAGESLRREDVAGGTACIVAAGEVRVGAETLGVGRRVPIDGAIKATASAGGCTLLVLMPSVSAAGSAMRFSSVGGWVTAAAALVLAAVGWFRPIEAGLMRGTTADASRLASARGTRVIPVQAQGAMASLGAIGEFVWNDEKQYGYLKLRRFERNDPQLAQYQAWFFDGTRDHQYPVSAGVFDISQASAIDRDGNLLVLIEPDLPIRDLDAFAVTLERSGGVVVTDKAGLVLLGSAGS